jgi:hypothetical protein
MNRLLILGILIIWTAPLFAQAEQPNAAELAQKVVIDAPLAELVRLSRTSIADEMREEHRRCVLGE